MFDTVSVVLPTYNSAETLTDAIDSIRAQGWPALDIIVVDDGSVDGTSAILEKIISKDLRVLRQENAGPGAARNRGIEAARGKWVAFLDADDVWLSGKLTAQLNALQEDPSLAFCYSDSVRRSRDGTDVIQTPRRVGGHVLAELLLGPQFDLSTVIVRRDCFEKVGGFAPQFRTGEDWDMWLRLAATYPGCYVPRVLVVYRVSGDPNKYPLEMHERCRIQIVSRIFSRPETTQRWPQIYKHKNQLFAWHYAVLAKSYLYRNRWRDFARLATSSILSSPMGLCFLARRWGSLDRWPNLAGIPDDGNPLERQRECRDQLLHERVGRS